MTTLPPSTPPRRSREYSPENEQTLPSATDDLILEFWRNLVAWWPRVAFDRWAANDYALHQTSSCFRRPFVCFGRRVLEMSRASDAFNPYPLLGVCHACATAAPEVAGSCRAGGAGLLRLVVGRGAREA